MAGCFTQKQMAFCSCICLHNFITEIVDVFQIYTHECMVCMKVSKEISNSNILLASYVEVVHPNPKQQ